MLTFRQLLENGSYFCEVVADIDMACSFDWDRDMMALNPAAIEEFASIMDLPAEILQNGNIFVDTSCDPSGRLDEEIDRFVSSVAGYCPESKWKAWFEPGY